MNKTQILTSAAALLGRKGGAANVKSAAVANRTPRSLD